MRFATEDEATEHGIECGRFEQLPVIELDNGVLLVALRDPEGNGPGFLTGSYKGTSFFLEGM